jgi:hypothetical protein
MHFITLITLMLWIYFTSFSDLDINYRVNYHVTSHCKNRTLNWFNLSLYLDYKGTHMSRVTFFVWRISVALQSARIKLKTVDDFNVSRDIRTHCFLMETKKEFRRPEGGSLNIWKEFFYKNERILAIYAFISMATITHCHLLVKGN